MSVIRICFFNSENIWGGGEKWHYETARYFSLKGNSILLFSSPNSPLYNKSRATGLNIQSIPFKIRSSTYLNPFKVKTLQALFVSRNIQIIVLNSSKDLKTAGLAAKKAGIRQIIFRRGSDKKIRNTFLNNYFYRKVITKVIANSPSTKESMFINNPNLIERGKVTVIPNGINVKTFLNTPFNSITQKKGETYVMGNLGRLTNQKNQIFLLYVVDRLNQMGYKVTLLIGGVGRLERSLKSKIVSVGLESQIHLLGFVKNPREFYHTIDLLVFPSLWEGFGYVLAEASLCELPIVAFDISSNSQVVIHGKTGLLTTPHRVDDFCHAIIEFISNRNKAKSFGQNGKRHIEKNFEMTEIMERIETFLL